jgi:glycerate dehydrogenase
MKIVVLDGHALNPGDLSWKALQELGEVDVFPRTEEHLIFERAHKAAIVLTNKTPLTALTIQALPRLRYIGVLATGYNVVDLGMAKARNLTVTNVPTYGTMSVAQFTLALLLELCHQTGFHSQLVRDGEWSRSPNWSLPRAPLVELYGKRLGIVGLGRIGRQFGSIAHALGMHIIAYSPRHANAPQWNGFRWCSLRELLAEADVVSLHCPLAPETRQLINAETLALMKRGSFLINTSRGQLIAENDLAAALNSGLIAGAALDVVSLEPPTPDNPLFSAINCIITPHIAWATRDARERLMEAAVQNVAAFLAGKPQNVVC